MLPGVMVNCLKRGKITDLFIHIAASPFCCFNRYPGERVKVKIRTMSKTVNSPLHTISAQYSREL